MRGIVVCSLVAALVIAAWWFGGYEVQTQFVVYSVALAAGGLWLIESVSSGATAREFVLPAIAIPFVAALLLGIWHLSPARESLVAQMHHAKFEEYTPVVAQGALEVRSLYPAATRLRLALFSISFLTLLVCCEPVRSRNMLRLVLGIIAVNGMCLASYGILRRIQGSEVIYETLSAQAGFSSFINRNQAAGFLNMSIAAAVGWLMLLAPEEPTRSTSRDKAVPRLPQRSFSFSRFLSGLSGEQLLASLCVFVMVVGVLMTFSRGGIASLAIAATIVALYFTRRHGIAAAGLTMTAGLAIALTVHLGEWSAVQTRLETLSDPSASWEGRLTHWSDTFGCVRDFPWVGTGWGTYPYANLPYQQHWTELWFVNADNLYFEALVEGGVVGLAVLLLAWGLFLGAVLRLMNPTAGRSGRALAIVGGMIWITQAVHSATDFGLLRPPNGLLFAVLMGLVISESVHNVRLKPPGRWLSPARLPGWSRVAVGVVCVGLAGLGIWETSRAAACETAVKSVPNLDELSRANDSIEDVDRYIDDVEQTLAQRRDDANARLKLAELWVHRYRLIALEELRSRPDIVDRLSEASLWNLSHPATLQRIYMIHVEAYGEEDNSIRQTPYVVENLGKAADELRLARRACPVSRQTDYLASMLGMVTPGDPSGARSIARSLFAAPARCYRLMDLGQLAWIAFHDDLAIVSFRQALSLSSREAMRAWRLLSERLDAASIVSRVLPNRPDVYFELLDGLPTDDSARELLISQLCVFRDAAELDLRSVGRLAELTEDFPVAIEAYKNILAESPGDLVTRVQIIRCYAAQHDFSSANDQLRQGLNYAPENSTLLKLKEELLELQLSE